MFGSIFSATFLDPEEVIEFVEEVFAGLLSDQEVRTFEEVIVPVLDIFQGRVKDLDLCQPQLYFYLDVLLYFSHHKDIAKVKIWFIMLLFKLHLFTCSAKRPTFLDCVFF